MINLLPSEFKKDVAYARRNRTMLRWTITILASALVAIFIAGAGRFYIAKNVSDYSRQLEAERQTFDVRELEAAQKQLEEISGGIKLVLQVLSREVLFSKLLKRLGAVTPPNTVLTALDIQGVQGAINLTIEARDIQAATQFQVNMQDPENEIFQQADIENITCVAADKIAEGSIYPCTAKIKALFGNNNTYLFLTKPARMVQP